MRITSTHVAFWCQRSGLPRWATTITAKTDPRVTVDMLINSQVDRANDSTKIHASNLLGLLRSMRKRGEMIEGLKRMAQDPGTVINPKRRAAYCKKWLRRIEKGR